MTRPNPRLRALLRIDAVGGVLSGVLMTAAAGPLAAWTGLPEPLMLWAGLSLFPAAALMAWTGERATDSAAAVNVIVFGNYVWAAASLALLAALSPGAVGAVFLLLHAAWTAVIGWLESRAFARRVPASA